MFSSRTSTMVPTVLTMRERALILPSVRRVHGSPRQLLMVVLATTAATLIQTFFLLAPATTAFAPPRWPSCPGSRQPAQKIPGARCNSLRLTSTSDTTSETTSRVNGGDNRSGGSDDDMRLQRREKQAVRRGNYESIVKFLFPFFTGTMAYQFHQQISVGFHNAAEWLSDDQWEPASNIVNPALNGPIVAAVSILLGTLVATTIANLYERQITIHRLMIVLVEECRQTILLLDAFPAQYRDEAQGLLQTLVAEMFGDLRCGELTPHHIRQKTQIGAFLLVLNSTCRDDRSNATKRRPSDLLLGQAYDAANRLTDNRASLISAIQTKFSNLHYFNLLALAGTISLIFLTETDANNLDNYVAEFQVKFCWSLLIGTLSMLSVVLYDLNSPFSNIFRSIRAEDVDVDSIVEYAQACLVRKDSFAMRGSTGPPAECE